MIYKTWVTKSGACKSSMKLHEWDAWNGMNDIAAVASAACEATALWVRKNGGCPHSLAEEKGSYEAGVEAWVDILDRMAAGFRLIDEDESVEQTKEAFRLLSIYWGSIWT